MKTSIRMLSGIVALTVSFHAQAYPGEGVALDPVTGNYTITYRGDPNSEELSQTVFEPATKITPAIRSRFRMDEQGAIVYRYSVSNGEVAKRAVVGVWLDQIVNPVVGEREDPEGPDTPLDVIDAVYAANKAALATPTDWRGNITRFRIDPHGKDLNRIAWSPTTLKGGGIPAGGIVTGFGFTSLSLPGMDVDSAKLRGKHDMFGYPDEGPLEDSAVFAEVERLRDNDFVALPAAVPTIAVPDPFDAAVTLERIQAHMHTWVTRQLLDATFSSQLDSYFQSAISAYRLNQPQTGKKHIQTLRELIKREQPDADKEVADDENDAHDLNKRALIGKLAARILDFDLKYVAKRMSGNGSD